MDPSYLTWASEALNLCESIQAQVAALEALEAQITQEDWLEAGGSADAASALEVRVEVSPGLVAIASPPVKIAFRSGARRVLSCDLGRPDVGVERQANYFG
jgi:hypothetical protein